MTLHLQRFEKRDIPQLQSWFASERDALQWAGAGLSWPLKTSEFAALLRDHRASPPRREVWAVQQSGEMIGHFQLVLNQRLQTVGIGRIAISPMHRGRGLADPLMLLVLQRAFQREWVHRADLQVYTHNTAAIRAYQRAGFVLEGTRRDSTPIGSERWDTHLMSILRPEFDKRTEQE